MDRTTLILVGLLVLCLPWACAADHDPAPPLYPRTEKFLSMDVASWMLPVVGSWIPHDGAERIISYVEGMPGDVTVKLFHTQGFPKPTPQEIHDFYQEWADASGYRLVVQVQHGDPPPLHWPEENERPHQSPDRWIDYDPDDYYWVNAYHRPSEDGGILVWVWMNHELYWFWVQGYIPLGPVLGEFLDMPAGDVDMTPPTELPPLGEIQGLPPRDGFFVHVRLGQYEIQAVAEDLGERALRSDEDSLMDALFEVAPMAASSIRAAEVFTYQGSWAKRNALLQPWHEWVADRGWPKLVEGVWDDVPVTVWADAGERGGALAVFSVDDTTTAVVCEGAPNFFALMPLLSRFAQGGNLGPGTQ